MTELVVDDIQLRLGSLQILKGASFTADKGQVVALLGASGSGKTTLLRSIAGLEQPFGGRIAIGGRPVFDAATRVNLPPEKRDIGLVFQSYALWPHRTVAENVAFGLKLRGVDPARRAARVQEMLQRLGLGHLGERYPYQLSGGQQQRVAICRALVYEPHVILLDEPLSNLDAKLREEARYFIRKLILDLGLCAVVVTHDQSEALAMADKIVLLKDGAILQEGAPADLYERPQSRYAAEFLGTNNVLHGTAEPGGLAGPDWRLAASQPLPQAGPAVAVLRADRLRVVDAPGANRIPAELESSIYLGQQWEYRLKAAGGELRAYGPRAIPSGPAWCEVPPEAVWIFPADAAPS